MAPREENVTIKGDLYSSESITYFRYKGKKNFRRELPPVGTILRHRFYRKTGAGSEIFAEVVKHKDAPDGRGVRVGKKVFDSLTAAAISITGRPTNGWIFWHVVNIPNFKI